MQDHLEVPILTAESHAEKMLGHTPGPWKWEHLPGLRGDDWTILSIGGLTVEAPSDSMYIACHQNDQRLIAAAPELLEACKEMKQLLDMVLLVNGGLPPDANGPAAKALAAIRKATGA